MSYFLLIASGIFSVSWLPELPSLWQSALLLVISLIALYRRWWRWACLLLAIIYGVLYGHYKLQALLPYELDHQVVHLRGPIVGLPKRDQSGTRFLLSLDHVSNQRGDENSLPSISGKINVFWPGDRLLVPGEQVLVKAKLKRPRGLVSPGAFDYQGYLFSQGITANAYVIDEVLREAQNTTDIQLTDCAVFSVDCLRFSIRQTLDKAFSTSSINGLAQALVIGDKSAISHEQMALLRDTGTLHLLAISGLHIGLVAGFGFYFGRLITRIYQLFKPLSSGFYFAPMMSIICAAAYSALAGFSLPTQRALIMVLVFHLSSVLGRKLPAFFSLSLALMCVALWDPLSVTQAGFWLSFLAVAVLLWGFTGRTAQTNVIASSIKSQWLLLIGLLLPGLVLLGGTSLSAPLANLFAITYVSVLVVPILLVSVVCSFLWASLADVLLVCVGYLLDGLITVLGGINSVLPGFSYYAQGDPSISVLAIAVVGVFFILSPLNRYWRVLGGLCILPVLLPDHQRHPFAIHFLDVGQGTAIIVEVGNRVAVYDTGPPMGPDNDAGAQIVAPFLRHRGFSVIDQLWVSHGDSDHAGGAGSLREQFPIMQTAVGESLQAPLNTSEVYHCFQGQHWQWGEVAMSVVWPPSVNDQLAPHYLFAAPLKSNNYSCTVLIEAFGKRFLLTGDIEKRAEIALLVSGHLKKNIDVLLVPHHGSQTSSSEAFLDYIKPQVAVVTAGFKNRYGHPNTQVMKRYQQRGVDVINTAEYGTISWHINRQGDWQASYSRDTERRYWHDAKH